MKSLSIFCAAALLAAATGGFAATINVPADQSTIQAAIDAAAASGDTIIVAPGTYVEGLLIEDKSITIQGSDPSDRPIVVLNAVTASGGGGGANSGLHVRGDGITVDISDMVFLPGSLTSKGVYTSTRTADATITVNFTNLLFTTNNGSNAPAVTDPFDLATPLGTAWPSDIFYLMNRDFLGDPNSNGNYTLTDVVMIGAGRESIVVYGSGPGVTATGDVVFEGCISSRPVRRAIQAGDANGETAGTNFIFNGSRTDPSFIAIGTPDDGIWINGAQDIEINSAVIVNNDDIGMLLAADNAATITVADSLVANNGSIGIFFYSDGDDTGGTVTIQDSTIANNGDAASNVANVEFLPADQTYSIIDSVIAGDSTHSGIRVADGIESTITVSFSALDTSLSTVYDYAGAGTVNEANNVNGNIGFISTTVDELADLAEAFDINGPASVAAANSVGEDLDGFGTYVAPLNVQAWELYQ